MTGPYVLQYPWPAPMTLEASRGPHVLLDEGVPLPSHGGVCPSNEGKGGMRGEKRESQSSCTSQSYMHTFIVHASPQVYVREAPHRCTRERHVYPTSIHLTRTPVVVNYRVLPRNSITSRTCKRIDCTNHN